MKTTPTNNKILKIYKYIYICFFDDIFLFYIVFIIGREKKRYAIEKQKF
jgi:hypothetical protein